MKIIGLTGVKGSGKTTTFNLIKELNPNINEITLADKIKNVCSEVFNIERSHLDLQEYKEKELEELICLKKDHLVKIYELYDVSNYSDEHIRPHLNKILYTPRQAAQYIGTEVLRNIDSDIHCVTATKLLKEDSVNVITDMRFESEYDYFNNLYKEDFHPYYIHNNLVEARHNDSHASEAQVLNVAKKCVKINNNGSIEDLKLEVQNVLNGVL